MNSNNPYWENSEELADQVRAFLADIEDSHCLIVSDPKNLPPKTKLLVTYGGGMVEFTILDSENCKVLVKDDNNFKEPKEGKLWGTKKRTEESTSGNFCLREWKLFPGRLFRMGLLAYEVDDKEYFADGIRSVQIDLPSGTSFNLWSDTTPAE